MGLVTKFTLLSVHNFQRFVCPTSKQEPRFLPRIVHFLFLFYFTHNGHKCLITMVLIALLVVNKGVINDLKNNILLLSGDVLFFIVPNSKYVVHLSPQEFLPWKCFILPGEKGVIHEPAVAY